MNFYQKFHIVKLSISFLCEFQKMSDKVFLEARLPVILAQMKEFISDV